MVLTAETASGPSAGTPPPALMRQGKREDATMIYTKGNIKSDALEVGDVIAIEWAKLWGPIVEIYPYGPSNTPLLTEARIARFASGAEMTLVPGETLFPH